MKTIITTIIASSILILTSCGGEGTDEAGESNKVELTESDPAFFKDVVKAEVWIVHNGMNSYPIVIEEPGQVKRFHWLISEAIEKKPDCKFTGGITFYRENGDLIHAEINLNDDCKTISYIGADNKMGYYNITKEGVDLLKETITKIDLPK